MEGQASCVVLIDDLLEPIDLSSISASLSESLLTERCQLPEYSYTGELFEFLNSQDCLSPVSTDECISPAVSEDLSPADCKIQCPKCQKICKSQRGLNQHIGKVHCKKKRHSVCNLCGSSFRSKYLLRFHMKQVHDLATRIACPLCDAVLYNKYLLPKHMKKKHYL